MIVIKMIIDTKRKEKVLKKTKTKSQNKQNQ